MDRSLNRASYNKIAERWDEVRASFYGREQHYVDMLLEGVVPGSTILDAGCGTGRPIAQHIIARGHRIIGVDQAERLLDTARARYPGERWVYASLEHYAFDHVCQGAVCWDTLFHIPREFHTSILARIARALVPGGRIMLTVGGSDHPPFTDQMLGETFFYDSHPPQQAIEILHSLRFDIVLDEYMNLPAGGRDKGRYAIVAARR
jgi:SAM-dependent methyltransferase